MAWLTTPLAGIGGVALLLARILLAVVFLYFGRTKIADLDANAQEFEKMGFKPGMFWGTLIALLETVGSALLILGFLTGIIAALFVIQMIAGTIWKIVSQQMAFTNWSYDLLLLALALLLMSFGPGVLAIDNLFAG